MYPRNPSSPTSESKKMAKREQLASLLVNKFRTKFRINIVEQRDLDDKITQAVYDMVLN